MPLLISSAFLSKSTEASLLSETWIHGQHQEPAFRELPRGAEREEVGGAVNHQNGDMGIRSGVGPVQGTLDRSWTELDIDRIALSQCLRRSHEQKQCKKCGYAVKDFDQVHCEPPVRVHTNKCTFVILCGESRWSSPER